MAAVIGLSFKRDAKKDSSRFSLKSCAFQRCAGAGRSKTLFCIGKPAAHPLLDASASSGSAIGGTASWFSPEELPLWIFSTPFLFSVKRTSCTSIPNLNKQFTDPGYCFVKYCCCFAQPMSDSELRDFRPRSENWSQSGHLKRVRENSNLCMPI